MTVILRLVTLNQSRNQQFDIMLFRIIIHLDLTHTHSRLIHFNIALQRIREVFWILTCSSYLEIVHRFVHLHAGNRTLLFIKILETEILEHKAKVGIRLEVSHWGGNQQIDEAVNGFLDIRLLLNHAVHYLKWYFNIHRYNKYANSSSSGSGLGFSTTGVGSGLAC